VSSCSICSILLYATVSFNNRVRLKRAQLYTDRNFTERHISAISSTVAIRPYILSHCDHILLCARCYASGVLVVGLQCLCVCLSVSHKPVMYRIGCPERAGFFGDAKNAGNGECEKEKYETVTRAGMKNCTQLRATRGRLRPVIYLSHCQL